MNKKAIATLLLSGTVAAIGLISGIPATKAESQIKFICGKSYDQPNNQYLPTTFAWTSRGKNAVIRWDRNLGSYTPQERCLAVSPRFQQAYSNGSLNLITNGISNGQRVICTAREYGGDCETVLITLRSKDNSLKILNDLKDTLNGRSVGPVKNNSGIPQIYYQINIDEFVRNAPLEK